MLLAAFSYLIGVGFYSLNELETKIISVIVVIMAIYANREGREARILPEDHFKPSR